jgi:hypothetical protein
MTCLWNMFVSGLSIERDGINVEFVERGLEYISCHSSTLILCKFVVKGTWLIILKFLHDPDHFIGLCCSCAVVLYKLLR